MKKDFRHEFSCFNRFTSPSVTNFFADAPLLSLQYKNKTLIFSKIQVQHKTQTLRKSYTFLSKACTLREHININTTTANNNNNNNNNKTNNQTNNIYIYIYIYYERNRRKKKMKTYIWGIKIFRDFFLLSLLRGRIKWHFPLMSPLIYFLQVIVKIREIGWNLLLLKKVKCHQQTFYRLKICYEVSHLYKWGREMVPALIPMEHLLVFFPRRTKTI